MKTLLTVTVFLLTVTASANADAPCTVKSPDGELNVREVTEKGPGKVIGTLKNGKVVTIRDFYLIKGKSWARVLDAKTKSQIVGWLYRDHLDCGSASDPSPATTAPNEGGYRPSYPSTALVEECSTSEKVTGDNINTCRAYFHG